jgi:hypothetical protein
VSAPLPAPLRYRQISNLYLAPTDLHRFLGGLRAAFPKFAFVERRRASTEYSIFDDPLQADEPIVFGWAEARDWRPDVQIGDRGPLIANWPRHYIVFKRCEYRAATLTGPLDRPTSLTPLDGPGDNDVALLNDGRFNGTWSDDDPEAERLVAFAIKTLKKMTVDRFVMVERRRLRPIAGSEFAGGAFHRAGPDAVAWAMARRHNYFSEFGRSMPMKPADYPYAPEEYIQNFDWSFGQKMPEHMAAREAARAERRRAKAAAKAAGQGKPAAEARRSGGKKPAGVKSRI